MRLQIGIPLLFLPAIASAGEPDGAVIEVGLRSGSQRFQQAVAVRLDDLDLKRSVRFDAQLQREQLYHGVDLAVLIARHPAASRMDLALLHFANGMIVPVPLLADGPALEVFVARGTPTFPPADKPNVARPDPQPIRFGANKVVVSNLAHPFAPDPAKSSFSPWSHTDTLTAIELVQRDRWEHQFDAGDKVRRGRDVFLARCQYCHGVREVGATFGWDLVDPIPLYGYRAPRSLYPHVRYQSSIAGSMMPPQKDALPSEVDELWKWMRAIARSSPAD